MQFMRDLNDEQLSEMMLSSDQLYVQRYFGGLPEHARDAADHPEFFWKRQESQIRARIGAAQKSLRRASLLWASSLSIVLGFALFMRDASQIPPVSVQPDPDQELLIAVEHAVGRDLPASLGPAELLSNEIISGKRSLEGPLRSKSRHKGNAK